MAVGLLEAFQLVEEHGSRLLTADEILFVAEARKRKGCRSIPSRLLADERQKVMDIGKRIKKWKEENK